MHKNGYIFVDLDGVLADFDKESAKYPEYNPWQACRTVKGFYKNLEVFEGAVDFVTKLEAAFPGRVKFLSAIVLERADSWTEKFEWIQQHFPSLTDRLILCRSKDAVGAEGDVLIDDHPKWNGSDKFRGEVIAFNTANIPNEYDRIFRKLIGAD